ncbi:MAG: hypothetical protein U1D30_08530 [Planctomycetota bacterium]
MNRRLDAAKIIETVVLLRVRIEERFPNSGLSRVAAEMELIANQAMVRVGKIQRANVPLRLFELVLVASIATIAIGVFSRIDVEAWRHTMDDLVDFVQFVEAGLGTVVFLGAAILFLFTMENRLKRKRALDALYELRSIVHIIDMHQLTKDPERLSGRWSVTKHSPMLKMTPFELNRYLDYCSELLSLTSKVGMLYGQGFSDSEVLAAIDQIESLANDLARKIWQKIMILDRWADAEELHFATNAKKDPPSKPSLTPPAITSNTPEEPKPPATS